MTKKDTVFTDTDLKAWLLKSMPSWWQNVYLLKGTQTTNNFWKILSYFVQLQNITDNQAVSKDFSASQGLDTGKQNKYMCTNHGQNCPFSSSWQSGWADIQWILQKSKTNSQGPFVDYQGPCPIHIMSSHTWEDCYNNPKNETSEGQHFNNNPNEESHSGQRYYYTYRGWGQGQGQECGWGSYNVPHLSNPSPTLYIQQACTNVPLDAMSAVTNTDTYTVAPTQTYMVKPMNNNKGENNSRWLNNNVVYCKAVYIDDIHSCETAADAKNLSNLKLPCANSQSHHLNSHIYPYPQGGAINGHQPDKNNSFYVFDTGFCVGALNSVKINLIQCFLRFALLIS